MGASRWLMTAVCFASMVSLASLSSADEAAKESPRAAAPKMTTQELADWIDQRFAEEYAIAGLKVGEPVDDPTFLRRVYLDLQGRVPTVAQIRCFLAESGSFKRQDMVDRLLIET